MVGSEQVYHSPVGHYGGSKPEVVNKNSEKLERMVFFLFVTWKNLWLRTRSPHHLKLLRTASNTCHSAIIAAKKRFNASLFIYLFILFQGSSSQTTV